MTARVAVIIGEASGIGRAACFEFRSKRGQGHCCGFYQDMKGYYKTIGVNQHGVAFGIMAAGRKMKELGNKGVIINTASVFGYLASHDTFAYQATKGAVRMMTQTAALELGAYGIRVVGMAPGGVDTPIIQGYKDMGIIDKLK